MLRQCLFQELEFGYSLSQSLISTQDSRIGTPAGLKMANFYFCKSIYLLIGVSLYINSPDCKFGFFLQTITRKDFKETGPKNFHFQTLD